MRAEVLYFEGCPTYRTTEMLLREVLAKEGIEANVYLVRVDTNEGPNGSGSLVAYPYDRPARRCFRSQSGTIGRWDAGRTSHPKGLRVGRRGR